MSTSDWVGISGSLVGGISLLLAACALLYGIRQYNHQVRAAREDVIRQRTNGANESLHNVRTSTSSLVALVAEGTAVISAASSISQALGARLGPNATRDDALRYLHNEQAILSVCIEGVSTSPAVSRVFIEVDRLSQDSGMLEGQAGILVFTSGLLRAIVADSTSPTLFMTLLKNIDSFEKDLVGDEHALAGAVGGNTLPLYPFLNALSIAMQGAMSNYVVARYLDALQSIDAFVKAIVELFLGFDSLTLHAAIQADVSAALSATTRTESILLILKQINIPTDKRNELVEQVKKIERQISKEEAKAHADSK